MKRLLGFAFASCVALTFCTSAQAFSTGKPKPHVGTAKSGSSKKASSGSRQSSGHLGNPKGRVDQWNIAHGTGGKKKSK